MGPTAPTEEDLFDSDDESWAYKVGKTKGLKEDRVKPPLIDLDSLGRKELRKFKTREEELDMEFEDAGRWAGILMTINEFRKFIWSPKRPVNDVSVINADIYDNDRRKAIKWKVEKFLHINSDQLTIEDYYITSKGGYIAWIKTDPRMINEIHRRAAKASIKDFRMTTFIPKLARDRKAGADRLLMDYKKVNQDFRFIVRNRARDIRVLIKRVSEGNFLPYRELSLNVLGDLSPLKTQQRESASEESGGISEEEDEGEAVEEGMENFQKPQRRRRSAAFQDKELIFRNITAILNGFKAAKDHQRM